MSQLESSWLSNTAASRKPSICWLRFQICGTSKFAILLATSSNRLARPHRKLRSRIELVVFGRVASPQQLSTVLYRGFGKDTDREIGRASCRERVYITDCCVS